MRIDHNDDVSYDDIDGFLDETVAMTIETVSIHELAQMISPPTNNLLSASLA
jgi:hypothetical protein